MSREYKRPRPSPGQFIGTPHTSGHFCTFSHSTYFLPLSTFNRDLLIFSGPLTYGHFFVRPPTGYLTQETQLQSRIPVMSTKTVPTRGAQGKPVVGGGLPSQTSVAI